MSCSCIPPPASLKPRKIYNFLVPDVFASSHVPDVAQPVSVNTLRKIGKLQEYVDHNPSKAGKVSRRLSRRIKKALYDRQLGYVKVAVEAYCCLLKASEEEDCSYTFSYFNKELVQQPDALISTLLSYQRAEVRTLGAQLLAEYVRVQTPTEHQAALVADLVTRVLKLLTSIASDASGGAKGATGSAATDGLQQQCLSVLSEYIAFCQRLKILPPLLEQIEVTLLDSVEQDVAAGKPIRASVVNNDGSVSYRAGNILGSFRPFLQDSSSVRRVVGTLLQWFDKKQRWENAELVQELIAVVHGAAGGLTYPLTSSLLRHCANEPSLTPKQRSRVARLAVQQGSSYSLSALNLALLELPRAVLAARRGVSGASVTDIEDLHSTAAEVCVSLARDVGHAGQVCEAIATVLRGLIAAADASADTAAERVGSGAAGDHGSDLTYLTLECALAVVQSLHSLPDETRVLRGRQLPASLLASLSTLASDTHTPSNTPHSTTSTAAAHTSVQGLVLRIIAGLLGSVDGTLKDDRQCATLLGVVMTVAEASSTTTSNVLGSAALQPADVAAASRIIRAAAETARAPVLLQVARTALGLAAVAATAARSGGGGEGSGLAAVVRAVLAENTAVQLAEPNQCSGLSALKVDGLPSLTELSLGPDRSLIPAAHTWSDASITAARGLDSAKLGTALATWQTQFETTLQAAGVLHTTWGAQLQAKLTPAHGSSPARVSGPGSKPAADAAAATGDSHAERAAPEHAAISRSVSERSSGSRKWAERQSIIRRERLNIARVMDILGGSEDDESRDNTTHTQTTREGGAGSTTGVVDIVDVALRSKPGVPLVANGGVPTHLATLEDVVKLVAAQANDADAKSSQTGSAVMSTRQLISQLAF